MADPSGRQQAQTRPPSDEVGGGVSSEGAGAAVQGSLDGMLGGTPKLPADLSVEALAANAAVAGNKRPSKQSRKSYTDYQKELVVLADQEGGRKKRLEVAHLIGMPSKTADHVVALFKAHGKEALHDARHDRRVHLGKGAKKDSELLRMMAEWLHLDARLTHKQLRDLVNLEIFRRIVKSEGLDLDESEQSPNTPISPSHIESYFLVPRVQQKYQQQHVENDNTVAHWLDGMVISRKHVLDDASVINDEENCKLRLVFAKDLLRVCGDPAVHVVFLDQVPLWLTMTHPPGQPVDAKIHEHVHAFLAAHITDGVFMHDCFVSDKLVVDQKHGLEHNAQLFKKFLDELCQRLLSDGIVKDIYIVADFPQAYIEELNASGELSGVPAWRELSDRVKAANHQLSLVKLPRNSPLLNYGEFFNRLLRSRANEMLHELVMDEKVHERFLTQSNHLLEGIVRIQLDKLVQDDHDASELVRLIDAIKETIAANGALDFKKTYEFLAGDSSPASSSDGA